ncbi:MAG: SPOR domain-containing protein [Sideroxydans sp.]|jgi:DedD protein
MAKQIRTDEEFTLQRQARRRLVGAIALMLAVVIFLPMIFDADPGEAVTRDIELHIPDKAVSVPVQPVAENAQQEAGPAVINATPNGTEQTVPPVIAPPVQTPAVAEPAPIVKPAEKSVVKPEMKQVLAAPAKPASKPSGWVIQVGAYSKENAAKQMASNLKQRGYPVYTEQAGSMTRVRIGHYPSKDAADKIRIRLEAIGLHPNVLNQE